MTHPVRFGATLPQIKRSWEEAREAAVEFDSLGFDAVFVCDHLLGVPMPNLPIFEAWSQLAAIAAITEHVELGTLVTPPFFRNPAVLAKQIATLDHISGGRAIAGLGAGWFEPEFTRNGIPFPSLGERMRALDESAEIMKRLWSEEKGPGIAMPTTLSAPRASAARCAVTAESTPPESPTTAPGGSPCLRK